MTRPATVAVHVAAAFLPSELSARYREQWLGELRDASEVGVSSGQIARGALAFSATYTRPISSWAHISVAARARWVQLALALSSSSALLAISRYASLGSSSSSAGDGVPGTILLAGSQLLDAFSVLAPLLSLIVVFAARGADNRVRVAVVLLVLASANPLMTTAVDRLGHSDASSYGSPGTVTYVVPCALVVAAAIVLVRMQHWLRPASSPEPLLLRVFVSGSAGILLGVGVAGGFIRMTSLWNERTPLIFGDPLSDATRASFEQWLYLKFMAEQLVATTFGLWIVVGLVVACLVALSGISRRATLRRVAVLICAAFVAIAVSYAGIQEFLDLMGGHATARSTDVLLIAGRCGLIALTMTVILRLSPSPAFYTYQPRAGSPVGTKNIRSQ